jgi:beta-lactamase regulating signal transducer with metallopeptidase domain
LKDLGGEQGYDIERAALAPAVNVIPWWEILFTVWAAAALISLAWSIIKHIRFVKAVRRWSDSVMDLEISELLENLKDDLKITMPVGLFRCTCIGSPMTMGLFHRRILLPTADYDMSELRFILTHELVHIRRRDILYRTLILLATSIHWFNPIVYLAGNAIDLLCEISCDDEVVSSVSIDARLRYSETIIGVVRRSSKLKTAFSTDFYNGKKGMKKRISSIMDMRKMRAGVLLACVMLLLTLATGFAFAATVAEQTSASIGQFELYDIVKSMESDDVWGYYEPRREGQISMGQAIDIAQAALSSLQEHLFINGSAVGIGIASIDTHLGQPIPGSMENEPDPLARDPSHAFWEVNIHGLSEEIAARFLIHAMTGTVWSAEIQDGGNYTGFSNPIMVSAEKALSGFLTNMGLAGFEYSESSVFDMRDTSEGLTAARSLPPDNRVRASVHVTSVPYAEDGVLFDGYIQLIYKFTLTTE